MLLVASTEGKQPAERLVDRWPSPVVGCDLGRRFARTEPGSAVPGWACTGGATGSSDDPVVRPFLDHAGTDDVPLTGTLAPAARMGNDRDGSPFCSTGTSCEGDLLDGAAAGAGTHDEGG